MTRNKLKYSTKTKIKSVIKVIFIFLFAISSSAVLIVIKKKNLLFDEREIYFVSVASSKKESELETKSELLKNLGGANVIYNKDNNFYLIANVYLDLSDAEEIKSNLSAYFPESQVLKIKTKAVTRGNKKEIKSTSAEDAFRYIYKLSKSFQDLQMGYLAGTIKESELISTVVKNRLDLENLSKVNAESELAKLIVGFGEMFCLQMSNFLTNFSITKSKQNYVCNYFVGFYINFIEMYDCL